MPADQPRYRNLNSYYRELFGCRVQKITVDAGLTCPNRDGTLGRGGCIYCNARGSGTGAFAAGQSLGQQIEAGKRRMRARYKAKKFVVYFQSFSNTYGPLKRLEQVYTQALSADDVVGLSIGTRPDCIDTPVLDLLQALAADALIWLEYGLQSAHDVTLALINRGHDFTSFCRAVAATRGRGIQICAHVILGLPGETRQQMMQTARTVAALGIDGIKLHLLYVIKGTPLETMYRRNRYRCLEQQQYVDLVCEFIEHLPPEMIIQRLTGDPHSQELVAPQWALQKTDTLNRIRQTLAERDSWQGKRFRRSPSNGKP